MNKQYGGVSASVTSPENSSNRRLFPPRRRPSSLPVINNKEVLHYVRCGSYSTAIGPAAVFLITNPSAAKVKISLQIVGARTRQNFQNVDSLRYVTLFHPVVFFRRAFSGWTLALNSQQVFRSVSPPVDCCLSRGCNETGLVAVVSCFKE